MSQDAFKLFIDRLKAEPELQTELSGLLDNSASLTVSEFAALGKRHDCEFSEDDIAGLQQAEEELETEALEQVVGGAFSVQTAGATLRPSIYSVQLATPSTSSNLLSPTPTRATLSSFTLRRP